MGTFAKTEDQGREEFLRSVANYVEYWQKNSKADSSREKLEGLAFSIMALIDGSAAAEYILMPVEYIFDTNGKPKRIVGPDIAGCLHEKIGAALEEAFKEIE